MSRLRTNRVCFTINNYEEKDVEDIKKYMDDNREIVYMVVGEEIGESGTAHLQGFVHHTGDPKKGGLKFWKNEIPGGHRAHFEAARGTDEQNETYCTKDGPFICVGEPQAQVNKWAQIIEAAKLSVEDAMAIDPEYGLKCFNQIKAIHDEFNHPQMLFELPTLRDWQSAVVERLMAQSDRRILFVVDLVGGKGKSALCKHLLTKEDTWACQGM